MISLRDMPVAVHFTKTNTPNAEGTFTQSRFILFNIGIGKTDFTLKCNVQHYRGSGRVKVHYGNTLLGEFGWHQGIAYIVGTVTTSSPAVYPGEYIKVTTEAYIDTLTPVGLLTIDVLLTCDNSDSPARKPYHVGRPTGTALFDVGVTPVGLTTDLHVTTEAPTTFAPLTPAPTPVITTATIFPTTATATSPPPTTYTTAAPITPGITPQSTVFPPATFPIDPTISPIMVKVPDDNELNKIYLSNYVHSNNTDLFKFEISGGHGIYAPTYSGLVPPMVIKSYPNNTSTANRIEDLEYSEDTYKVVSLQTGGLESSVFTNNQLGEITFDIGVTDSVNVDSTSDVLTIKNSSGIYVDNSDNDTEDFIVTSYDISRIFNDFAVSGAADYMTNQPSVDLLKFSYFPSAAWYMAFQNIKNNAMMVKIKGTVEPASIKNWQFVFTPATTLKDKLTLNPNRLLNSDNVYLDTTAATWYDITKCFIMPRFTFINGYYYWLFVFPDFAPLQNIKYLDNPLNVVWSKLSREYQFNKGGPFVFSNYVNPDPPDANGVYKVPAPIFYAGTFRGNIKSDDNTTTLKTTGDIDFWYTAGNKAAIPSDSRINRLKLNLT